THPDDEYYNATIDWFEKYHGWKINRDEIMFTTGVVPALSATIKALTKPGDGVVILTPVYTCFFSSIRNNGCHAVECSLKLVGDRYEIDFDSLAECLKHEDVHVMVLCNPHNPGGCAWTPEELARVAELASDNGVTVVSDEIHCEIVMPGFSYTPYAKVATAPYVSFISPSKAFNTAGLHAANIVSPSPEIRKKIDRAINDNETCDIGPFAVTGLIAAYRHGRPWLEAMIDYVHENYLFLKQKVDGVKGIRVLSLEATYLAWLDVKALGREVAELCEDLRKDAKVWFHPGTMYGEDGQGYIRINLATSRTVLEEALKRFLNYISSSDGAANK
ncbi:MAG: aminotransferase class I/II-fold pyridoxal phosphate-dependent enzyme, partial [Muribaculaceae bacterium]|nr:aminotransferase class I/II-fold pyridoxal phosphate-dependent enzyme [Muribaculaceae bacterium]